jgi:hypothetical protein
VAFALLSIAASLTLVQGPVLPQASIAGTVRDGETRAPIAGAVVVLSDLSRGTTADTGGHYLLTGVSPGPQHLTVRFMGYAPRVVHALVPSGSRLEIDVTLRATPVRLPTVVARAGVAVRGLEEAAVAYPDRAASLAAIRSDPLLDGGKVLAVWRRQPDGSWLVSRAVWNSDLARSDNLRPGT